VEQSLNRGNEAEIPYREIRGLKYNLKNNLYFNLCSLDKISSSKGNSRK
jgi:hypothetical protein